MRAHSAGSRSRTASDTHVTRRLERTRPGAREYDAADPGVQLRSLISRQAVAVTQMRGATPAFLADEGFLCADTVPEHGWSRRLEERWASVVGACMNLGYLEKGDAFITTRLILGMIIAAAKQRQPDGQATAEQITCGVVTLLRLDPDGPSI